jgi:hypothetical protein
MKDIEILEYFYNFNNIIKKEKKAKNIYLKSLSKIKSTIFVTLILSYVALSMLFFVFIGIKFGAILLLFSFFLGAIFSFFSSLYLVKKFSHYRQKKHSDCNLLQSYIDTYLNYNSSNISKVKNIINNTISKEEVEIFFKLKNLKNKAIKEYTAGHKYDISKYDKKITEFYSLDENYFLTLKYALNNSSIEELKKINHLNIKKSLNFFSLEEQIELSEIINKKLNSKLLKKDIIEKNLNILSQQNIKKSNIINI